MKQNITRIAYSNLLVLSLATALLLVSSIIASAQIATGGNHTIAVQADGKVWAWGCNLYGQLGTGATATVQTYSSVVNTGSGQLTGITKVAAGANHSVALRNDGTVWSWGYNGYGQMGSGTNGNNSMVAVEMQTSAGTALTGITAIAAGDNFTLALKNDGTVWAAGCNTNGQLGTGTTTSQVYAVEVTGVSSVSAIAAGSSHSLAISGGVVWAWGKNANGQLGNNSTTQEDSPVQVSSITNAVAIAGGAAHSVAIESGGTVWAWGDNANGQLGDNTTTQRLTPVQSQNASSGVAVAAGASHSVMLKSDGTVWTWGMNNEGQLGDGTQTDRHTAVQMTSIASGTYITANSSRTIVECTTGFVYGAGDNTYDAFDNGQQVGFSENIGTVPGVCLLTQVAAGEYFSLALKNDGTVWAFGQNGNGQLGNNSTIDSDVVVQTQLSGNASAIAAGWYHGLAVVSGNVWAWGDNSNGQLGNGTTTQSNTPVEVSSTNGVLANITAVAGGDAHSVALKSDGTVWAWGSSGYGQVGNGSTTSSTNAVQVMIGSGTALTGITAIAAGEYHSVALKNDGTVWAWGYNSSGQLGNGTTISSSYAVQVSLTGTSISAICAGADHTVALTSNGTLLAWGQNYSGQLGNGTVNGSDVPVVVSSISSVQSIAAGGQHTMAVTTNGSVYAWGTNLFGQPNFYSHPELETPALIPSLAGATSVTVPAACGQNFSLLIMPFQNLAAWGEGTSGQLGNGMLGYVTPASPSQFELITDTTGLWVDETSGTGGNGSFAKPYQTIQQAVSASGTGSSNMRISVRSGTYPAVRLDSSWGMKSGTPGNPFVLRGMPGERAIISNMKQISGWTLVSGSTYVANTGTFHPDSFYVGMNERLMAQSPVPGSAVWTWQSESITSATSTVITDTNHLIGVGNLAGGYCQFTNSYRGANEIQGVGITVNDPVNGTMTLDGSLPGLTTTQYIIKNCQQLIVEPGQWACIPQSSGTTYNVYYWPVNSTEQTSMLSSNPPTQARCLGSNSGIEVYMIKVHDMVVEGLEMMGGCFGVESSNCSDITLQWNIIHDNGGGASTGGDGIYLIGLSGTSTVSNNVLTLNLNGFCVQSCTNTVITQNDVGYNYIDGFDLTSDNNLHTPCVNVTISNNYIHDMHNLYQHPDAIQSYDSGVQNLQAYNNLVLGVEQSMINGLAGGTFSGNVYWGTDVQNLGYADGLGATGPIGFNDNVYLGNITIGGGMGVGSVTGYENVVVGRWIMATGTVSGTNNAYGAGDRNLVYAGISSGTYDTAQFESITTWKNFGYLNTGAIGWYNYCGKDQNSKIGTSGTCQYGLFTQFVNMPTSIAWMDTSDITQDVVTGTSTTISLGSADYAVGDFIEFNHDGVPRQITAINTGSNSTITFTPPLYGFTPGDGLGYAPYRRTDCVENWGKRSDFTRDSRLAAGYGLTMSSTGGPIGSPIIIGNYNAGDFTNSGYMEVPALPPDVAANLAAHNWHISCWMSYGNN